MSNIATLTTIQFATHSWMHDLTFLRDRPLKDLVIPGSHDAGTYVMEYAIDKNSSQCQHLSIRGQLDAGSRYLDLRAWKAKDGEYWMFHGGVWTHVKLAAVLDEIKSFLKDNPDEVVIATLLIDSSSNVEAGWQWACAQVSAQMLTPADAPGKSFAHVTLNQLRDVGKRLVMLRSGHTSQLACMDREGVYGDSLYPQDYLDKLDAYRPWDDKMWILHLGIPYKGDIHNTMPTRAKWNADEFVTRFKGAAHYENWLTKRLNIINVDFVEEFGWVDAIVRLNAHYPKTLPKAIPSKTTSTSFTWKLKASERNGLLWLEASTDSPFRAQQGQIHVYQADEDFPVDPAGKAVKWEWDNQAAAWNTGLMWHAGMRVAWVGEKPANGPYVLFLKLVTKAGVTEAEATFTWTLRSGSSDNVLYLEGDSDAPFRAQQGQLHVYRANHDFPTNPEGQAEAWQWDNDAHPWNTKLNIPAGRRVAWTADRSPNGPRVLFVRHLT